MRLMGNERCMRTYNLLSPAEDVLELGMRREHLGVHTRCDGEAVLREYRHSSSNQLALLSGQWRRVREVRTSFDIFAHVVEGV